MQTKGPNILQCSVMWFTHLQASTGTPEACPTHSHTVHLHPSPKSFMTQQSLGDHFQCHGSVILLCKNETCELHTVFFPVAGVVCSVQRPRLAGMGKVSMDWVYSTFEKEELTAVMLKISVQALLCPKSYQGQAKANSMGAYHQDDLRDASRSPHACQSHFKKSHCFVTHWGHSSAWVIFHS